MYCAYGKRKHLRVEILDVREGPPGIRQATIRFAGEGADTLAGEGGVHAVQHITRSRRKDRIHTSTASVAVFPMPRDAHRPLPMAEVRIDTFRGSGPGGQHRNVTDSGVRATHVPTGLSATVTSGRSQGRNRETALQVLHARWLHEQEVASTEAITAVRRRQIAGASRSATGRVYDKVRNVVRVKNGNKVRGVDAVLAGNLELLQ